MFVYIRFIFVNDDEFLLLIRTMQNSMTIRVSICFFFVSNILISLIDKQIIILELKIELKPSVWQIYYFENFVFS